MQSARLQNVTVVVYIFCVSSCWRIGTSYAFDVVHVIIKYLTDIVLSDSPLLGSLFSPFFLGGGGGGGCRCFRELKNYKIF